MLRVVLCVLLCVPQVLAAAPLININIAPTEKLETLPGIGSVYAERIVAYRSDTPFVSIEDIQNVSGIGPATFAKIKDKITVGEEEEGSVIEEKQVTQEEDEKDIARVRIDAPDITFVNQKTVFIAVPYPEDNGRLVHYEWNFGDLSHDTKKEVSHRFMYPGEYVVIVEGESKGEQFSARHEITVLPTMFSITRSPDGDIQIHNDASEEVDISGFVLSEVGEVIVPEGTKLLPYATLTVPRERIEAGGTYGIPRLYDAVGTLVATFNPHVAAKEPITFATSTQPAAVVEAVDEPSNNLAYIGLLSVLTIGILGVYTRRRESPYIEDLDKTV